MEKDQHRNRGTYRHSPAWCICSSSSSYWQKFKWLESRRSEIPSSMVVLGDESCAESVGDTGSFALRIGGLFAILGGSAILTFLPLLLRRKFDTALLLGACFASGVILSTAFNHILPDAGSPTECKFSCPLILCSCSVPDIQQAQRNSCRADAAMSSPCLGVGDGYPWSFVIAGGAVIVSLIVENTLKGVMLRCLSLQKVAGCECPADKVSQHYYQTYKALLLLQELWN